MGCGGSKDVVVSTNVTEDNNNTETKDVVTSNQRSTLKCNKNFKCFVLSGSVVFPCSRDS